jgi:hypothetical protein
LSLFGELRRRNVLRVGTAYAIVAWLVIQVVETILPAFGFGDSAVRIVTIFFAVGLVPTLVDAWVFELTPEGLRKDEDVEGPDPAPPGRVRRLDQLIVVLAFRDEPDQAFMWLDKAAALGDPGLLEIAWQPLFGNIRRDPRWLPFLRRIGYAPEQLAAIDFEVTLPGR